MNRGIREEASNAHQTAEICMAELERCQRESQGYSYVFLGCQKYGFRPFPAKIPREVFEQLRAAMAADCQALLDACFRLDTNVYPAPPDPAADINEWLHGAADSGPGPVYVLQSSKNIADWWAKFEEMQLAFRKAAQTIWADAPLRDPASKAFIKRFFISVTEEEFSRGLLWVKKDEQRDKCLVFRRTIKDLASHAADPAQLEVKKFIDMQGGAVDQEAQELLEEQLKMTPDEVKTIEYPDIEWGPGIDPANPGHADYLRAFLDDFAGAMVASVDGGAKKLALVPDAVVEEARQHLAFALVRAGKFLSTTSTSKVESAAVEYLSGSGGGASTGKALVIFGRSGAGKTYLLSKIMAECLRSRAAHGAVVMRFLGTTTRSSNVHALLTSLCAQLRRVYAKDDAVPSDFKELVAYFKRAVTEWPSPDQPLTLFIDSVDQLNDSNGGRRLDWLPVTGLPAHVRLVVSTLPDYAEFQCLSILRAKLADSAGSLDSHDSHCVEVGTISEPDAVLQHLLRLQGRTITDAQLKHVLEAFEKRTEADAAGTPLWLTIVAQTISMWRSYEDVPFAIKPGVRDLIIDLFERLATDHGAKLVRAALAYITLAKAGVSETELNHLLSLQDDVLADSYEWWVPPVRIAPPLLLTRLLTDLAPYLTRRGDGSGVELVSWYHRQFWEAAEAWLFRAAEGGAAIKLQKQQRHAELADYFAGRWADTAKPYTEALKKCVQRPQFFPDEDAAERNVPHQPLVLEGDLFLDGPDRCRLNTRRIHELVKHLIARCAYAVDMLHAGLT